MSAKRLDGRLWCRRPPRGAWERAPEAPMIARRRQVLVVEAADLPEGNSNDPAWRRGVRLAAKSAALLALGR